jgi:hypothetical protein
MPAATQKKAALDQQAQNSIVVIHNKNCHKSALQNAKLINY